MVHFTQVPVAHVEIIEKVMAQRTKRGFSTDNLSFLIGKTYDYIRMVETFKEKCYPICVLKNLKRLFKMDDEILKLYRHNSGEIITMCYTKYNELGSLHSQHISLASNKKKLRFFVTEPDEDAYLREISNMSDWDLAVVVDMLFTMARDGYLDKPRLPMDIFLYMNKFLEFEVSPCMMSYMLEDFCDDSHDFKLMQVMKRGYLHYKKDLNFKPYGKSDS